jgi:nicotinate-nucleotide adenylyltransferase
MGADNLRHFHRWQKWREIAKLVPIVVIDRLGPSLYAAASPAGQALSRFRLREVDASTLPDRIAPAWTFLHGLKSPLSSTALRALRGKTPADDKNGKKPRPVPKIATKTAAKKTTKGGKKRTK